MAVEAVMGVESRSMGEAWRSNPLNTDIISQKHKLKTEQYIFGIKPTPSVVLNMCRSFSKNVLGKKSLKQCLKVRGGHWSALSLLPCILSMREISPRFWLIPGLLLPVWNSRSALLK